MPDLSRFETLRREAYRALGDIEDGLGYRGPDWPTDEQAKALARALRHIAAAKQALNEVAP